MQAPHGRGTSSVNTRRTSIMQGTNLFNIDEATVISGGPGGVGGSGGLSGGLGGKGGSVTIHRTADDHNHLERLPGWNLDGVRFNESKACLDGTRKKLLDDICSWAYSNDDRRILWLSGGAGTGKTSVANSVALIFHQRECLGACFFFNRDSAGLNNPNYLFGNICYQLAHFDEQGKFGVRRKILAAIRKMGHIGASSLRSQARQLIVDPTHVAELVDSTNGPELVDPTSVPELMGPVLIVIDAIDESGFMDTRRDILEAVAAEFPRLPRYVKVMITSRDELDIRESLQGCSKELCIDDTTETVEDIASYIRYRLAIIPKRLHLRPDWPGSEKLMELVNHAGGLFIWAAVACNFILEKRNPAYQLDLFLDLMSASGTGPSLEKLDTLYNSILRNAFPNTVDSLADFRYIVGSIIVLEVPLTQSGLDSLLGFKEGSGEDLSVLQNGIKIPLVSSGEILSLLCPIVRADSMESSGKDGPLRLLHPSVYDFLTSHADEAFKIDPLEQHWILAVRCLIIMNSQLKFNICQISNLSLINDEIEDLPRRIDCHISEGLHYSCLSIGHHLMKLSNPNMVLQDGVMKFISEHLLHWIEVMSLLGGIIKAEKFLVNLASWLKENMTGHAHTQSLVEEAILLLRNFGNGIQLSALHAYYSALPLTPIRENLFQCFIKKVPLVANVMCSHQTWANSLHVLEGHGSVVTHVEFSPDGTKLASASEDWTVWLWDVKSGQAIKGPLIGHNDEVRHVTFSPNGTKLASASYDCTVRLWDVESGLAIRDPLVGHTDQVKHVTFSPDGTKLASASYDNTVQLWDVGSGKAIREPLVGHTGWVFHVTFSPDGTKLASASGDYAIQLWDVESGNGIRGPLEGHTGMVLHVTFAPDGATLASASVDCTVQLWDVESGWAIREPLVGHTGSVLHVTFSPDGAKLASASGDSTVRLWNVESGKAIKNPLVGHTAPVSNVTFSPDGTTLASASYDCTVQLWDAESGQAIRKPLVGHTAPVSNVTFSPDGKKLASASFDNTVQLWDVEGEGAITELLAGHAGVVYHVTFSPDGTILASASVDHTMQLWDVQSCRTIGESLVGHTGHVRHVTFSPDGKKLASASDDGTVWLWGIESGQVIREPLVGHTGSVQHVTFSPDGTRLASASEDCTACLWDVESDQGISKLLVGHTDGVKHVVFSPDGTILASVSYNNAVWLWDVESGQVIINLFVVHTDHISHLSFSPNGTKLISISYCNTVQVWEVESGQYIGDLFIDITYNTHQDWSMLTNPYLPSSLWDSSSSTKHDHKDGINLVSSSVDQMLGAAMSINHLGFLCCGRTRLLWLPVALRGLAFVVKFPLFVVGGRSGAITFIQLPGLAYHLSTVHN